MHIVGIAGGSGSGKTTFAKKVLKEVAQPISLIHMDSYYLATQPESNKFSSGKPNFDSPHAFDWNLLKTHLEDIKQGKTIHSPCYDFKSSSRTSEIHKIEPTPIVIFEGILSLYDKEIRNLLDICVYLHVDSDIRFTRRLNRDIRERGRSLDSIMEQYYESVRPMHIKYLEPQKQYADFIIGEESDNAALILASRFRELMSKANNSDENRI